MSSVGGRPGLAIKLETEKDELMSVEAGIDAEFQWLGLAAVRFWAGGYEAVAVPSIGGNLSSLQVPRCGLDLLRAPNSADAFRQSPQTYGLPMLLFPNRIADGVFAAEERTYRFPINEAARGNHIHGFIHHSTFTVERAEVVADRTAELELRFRFDSSGPEYAYFPQEFLAVQTYRLAPEGLTHELSVRNEGNKPMPIGVAVHSNFKVPFSGSSSPGDCLARVAIGRKWELDERILPTGGFVDYDEPDRALAGPGFDPVSGIPLAACCYDAAPVGNRAEIADKRVGFRVIYEPDGAFKFWIAWNKDGYSGFISLEPQSWMINAPNLTLPAEETGMRVLYPGEEWRGTSRLWVEAIS